MLIGGAARESFAFAGGPADLNRLVGGCCRPVRNAAADHSARGSSILRAHRRATNGPPPARARARRWRRRPTVPAHCTISQFCRGAKFFSSDGRSPMLLTTISREPSLSRSPTADPRDDRKSLSAGPEAGEMSLKRPPMFQYSRSRLSIADLRAPLHLRVHVPVDEEQILASIMIDIQELRAPADVLHVGAQARRQDPILERAVAEVVIQVRDIVAEVRLEDVGVAVFIVIGRRRRPCRPVPDRLRSARRPTAVRLRETCRSSGC